MKCRKCGAQMRDDELYCPQCGTHIPISADEITENDIKNYMKEEETNKEQGIRRKTQHQNKNSSEKNPYRHTGRNVAIAAVIIIVIMALAGSAVYVFRNDHSDGLKNSFDQINSAAKYTPPPSTPSPEPTPEPTPMPTPSLKPSSAKNDADAPPAQVGYSTYTDPEFNFSCSYPDTFEKYIESAKSSRYSLHSKDGTANLRICAEADRGNITIEQSLAMFKAQTGGSEEYVSSGETYYAVRLLNNSTYYYKYLKIKNGNMYWFEFTYPSQYHEIYDAYVNHIYTTFDVK